MCFVFHCFRYLYKSRDDPEGTNILHFSCAHMHESNGLIVANPIKQIVHPRHIKELFCSSFLNHSGGISLSLVFMVFSIIWLASFLHSFVVVLIAYLFVIF